MTRIHNLAPTWLPKSKRRRRTQSSASLKVVWTKGRSFFAQRPSWRWWMPMILKMFRPNASTSVLKKIHSTREETFQLNLVSVATLTPIPIAGMCYPRKRIMILKSPALRWCAWKAVLLRLLPSSIWSVAAVTLSPKASWRLCRALWKKLTSATSLNLWISIQSKLLSRNKCP